MRKRSLVASMCAVTLTLTAYGSNVSLCTVKAQGNSQENALEDSQESTQSVNQRAAGKLDDSKLIKEPFKIKDGLIDESKTNIGLDKIPGAETCTIFSAAEGTDHYVNGIVMTEFKGKLYCQWQSSQKDEDAPDT